MTANGTGRLDVPPTHAELTEDLAATEADWHQAEAVTADAYLEWGIAVRGYVEAVRANDRPGKEWALGRVTTARVRHSHALHEMIERECIYRETVARYEAERRQAP